MPRSHAPHRRAPTERGAQHAGVLVPWANSVVEAELPRWGGSSVVWHYARLVPSSRATALDEDFLTGLLSAAPAAMEQLAALPLQQIYLACTSAAFMLPSLAEVAAAGHVVPLVTAFDAILVALQSKGVSRIILLTPYPDEICQAEADTFRNYDIKVDAYATLNVNDGYATIKPVEVRELLARVHAQAVARAQAIVLSCTGWPTLRLGKTLARELGKEVISSNRAIAIHALQEIGRYS
jgi:maleate isomerase